MDQKKEKGAGGKVPAEKPGKKESLPPGMEVVPDEYDVIVTLHDDETDEDIDFVEVYRTTLDGRTFMFLAPDKTPDDMADNDAIFFESVLHEDGRESVSPVQSAALRKRLYECYVRDFHLALER